MSKDLGKSTSYAYYVAEGGTKTPQEYGEMLVNIDTVATRAEDAADSAAESATGALNSKNAAQTAATTATTKASEATTAATTATNKAAEAQADADAAALDASQALSAASTATTKASEATTAAATATSAATTATTAKDDAVSAKTAAQTAQAGAETAAASVQSSAAQIQTNADDISELKEELIDIDGTVLNKASLVLGNINASTSGWVYQVRSYGVITKQGYTIPIKKGTRIFLTDYTFYKIGISWVDANSNYGTSDWITEGYYETTVDGDYVLNVQLYDTSGTASINTVWNILKINGGRLNEVERKVEELTPLPPTNTGKIGRVKILDTIDNSWGQGVAKVGDYVLMFKASNDTHTNHANVDVYNISDLTTRLFYIEHNLGHCASADYNEETDTLLIANGTYESGVDSIIYLIPNISTLLENRTSLEYGSANVHAINITSLSGEGVLACFGESSNTIYAITVLDGTNYDTVLTKYLYKLYIGKGTTDMVSTFPASSVGTYTAQSDEIPNGTARILMSASLDFPGELQGLKYDGQILLPFDTRKLIHTVKMPYLAIIEATNTFSLKEIKYMFLANDNGNVMQSEMEDMFITDTNIAYISNGSNIFKIMY